MQRMTVSAGIRRSPIRTPAMRGADSSLLPARARSRARFGCGRLPPGRCGRARPQCRPHGRTRGRHACRARPSTQRRTPQKKVRVSCVSKPDRALYRKRGFVSTCRRNSSRSQSLVTLHRPFPVMRSFAAGAVSALRREHAAVRLTRGLQGLGGGDCRHHAGGTGADNQHARSVGHTLISPSAVDSGLFSYTS